jgi:hypothetical protein
MFMTFLPARAASRVPVAEALRYERRELQTPTVDEPELWEPHCSACEGVSLW